VNLTFPAGQPAPKELLVDVARREKEYFERRPDLDDPNQLVSFGTSGHRGSPCAAHLTKRASSQLPSYLKRAPAISADAAPELMRLAWSSSAALAIATLQDLLNWGSEARMNVPGRANGNWRWRVREDMLTSQALQDLTESCKRSVSPATSVRTQVDSGSASAQI
jgi:4-alpha-glucanotransferase